MGAYSKNIVRTVSNNLKRYIAIVVIVALGVAFFVGLRATAPAMQASFNTYFDKLKVHDLRIMTNYGLDDESVADLQRIPDLKDVTASYFNDYEVGVGDKALLMRFEALNDGINEAQLVEGRMPEKADEIVVQHILHLYGGIKIGDTITILNEDNLADEMKYQTYTIVGSVNHPAYTFVNNETSAKGSGRLEGYFLVPKESFANKYYTEIFAHFDIDPNISRYSDEYETIRKEKIDKIKPIVESIARKRLTKIKDEASVEIRDAEAKIIDAEQKLLDGHNQLVQAETEINKGADQLKSFQQQLADGKLKYDEGLALYNQNLAQFQATIAENRANLERNQNLVENGIIQAEAGLEEIAAGLAQVDAAKTALVAAVNQNLPTPVDYQTLLNWRNTGNPMLSGDVAASIDEIEGNQAHLIDIKIQTESTLSELYANRTAIRNGFAQLEQEQANGQAALDAAKAELDASKNQLDTSTTELEKQNQTLETAQQELEKGKQTYEQSRLTAEEELAKAKEDIRKAKAELNDMTAPKAIILGLESNLGYANLKQDSSSIEAISKTVPLIFFLVAALVTMTNMLRIVEDDRSSIGLLKALGYGKLAIASKYLSYAFFLVAIGTAIGVVIGYRVLPLIIYNGGFGLQYYMAEFTPLLTFDSAALATILAIISVFVPTISVLYQMVFGAPAELMRPKAPTAGKKVFLEYVPFIWRRLNFSAKVTLRNIFRYKKRFFMTIIGIAGCTGLILLGFGLTDAITPLASTQFEQIHHYDYAINLKEKEPVTEGFENFLKENFAATLYTHQATFDAKTVGGKKQNFTLIVPREPSELGTFIYLYDTNGPLVLDDTGIVISKKLGQLVGCQPGDTITIIDPDNNEYHVRVAAITENYLLHYLYMSPEYYQQTIRSDINFLDILTVNELGDANVVDNTSEVTNQNGTEEQPQPKTADEIATELKTFPEVSGVFNSRRVSDQFTDMIVALQFITLVLIVCAGLLAFVVLFSLTSINIDERARELATLKVLGLYQRETSWYIFRENLVLTVIGALLGTVVGKLLQLYIIKTVQLDLLLFMNHIRWQSYAYSVGITFFFSLLVSVLMNRSIKKIDMVESLKSIE